MEMLETAGIKRDQVLRFVPNYVLDPVEFESHAVKYWCMYAVCTLLLGWPLRVLLLLRWCIVGRLEKRLDEEGVRNPKHVRSFYDLVARFYELIHHLTTNGMDTTWRRWIANHVVSVANTDSRVRVLDLCTGAGSTVLEMVSALREYSCSASIWALDFSAGMLGKARSRLAGVEDDQIDINPVLGDATALINGDEAEGGMVQFDEDSFHLVSQMFGIGGIPEPIRAFTGVLRVLKPGGKYAVTDMHMPVPSRPSEFSVMGLGWFRFPMLEALAYWSFTVPLALVKLWAWRDTTACFYLLPLTTWEDSDGKTWGFEVESFETETQRWYFKLGFMPVARIVGRKVEIHGQEAAKRQVLLEAITVH